MDREIYIISRTPLRKTEEGVWLKKKKIGRCGRRKGCFYSRISPSQILLVTSISPSLGICLPWPAPNINKSVTQKRLLISLRNAQKSLCPSKKSWICHCHFYASRIIISINPAVLLKESFDGTQVDINLLVKPRQSVWYCLNAHCGEFKGTDRVVSSLSVCNDERSPSVSKIR